MAVDGNVSDTDGRTGRPFLHIASHPRGHQRRDKCLGVYAHSSDVQHSRIESGAHVLICVSIVFYQVRLKNVDLSSNATVQDVKALGCSRLLLTVTV